MAYTKTRHSRTLKALDSGKFRPDLMRSGCEMSSMLVPAAGVVAVACRRIGTPEVAVAGLWGCLEREEQTALQESTRTPCVECLQNK